MICISKHAAFVPSQVLIYTEREGTEFLWALSSPSNIPLGAVIAGNKSNGDLLYLASTLIAGENGGPETMTQANNVLSTDRVIATDAGGLGTELFSIIVSNA